MKQGKGRRTARCSLMTFLRGKCHDKIRGEFKRPAACAYVRRARPQDVAETGGSARAAKTFARNENASGGGHAGAPPQPMKSPAKGERPRREMPRKIDENGAQARRIPDPDLGDSETTSSKHSSKPSSKVRDDLQKTRGEEMMTRRLVEQKKGDKGASTSPQRAAGRGRARARAGAQRILGGWPQLPPRGRDPRVKTVEEELDPASGIPEDPPPEG